MDVQTHWIDSPVRLPDEAARAAALERLDRLTKPRGALGALESVAADLAGHQGKVCPDIRQPEILVFAADHGVAATGVSAYPAAVTAQMVMNFLSGGAAISVLARHQGARLTVVDAGVAWHLSGLPQPAEGSHGDHNPAFFVNGSVSCAGSADLSQTEALTAQQLAQALEHGRQQVLLARARGCDLLILGEMGIGNTTAASALCAALTGVSAEDMTGRGTGIDDAVHALKTRVVRQALERHHAVVRSADPLSVLRCLGGCEIAALTGAMVAAAQHGITLLVDGFIVSAAALVACRIQPAARAWMLFAHQSAEAGHNAVLSTLKAQALMNIGMRLGEGSGAAVALPLLRTACALHAGMATFGQAGVEGRKVGLP